MPHDADGRFDGQAQRGASVAALGRESPPRDIAGQRGRAGGGRPAGRRRRRIAFLDLVREDWNAVPGRAGRRSDRAAQPPPRPCRRGPRSSRWSRRARPCSLPIARPRGSRKIAGGSCSGSWGGMRRLVGDGRPAIAADCPRRRPHAGRRPAAPRSLAIGPDDRRRPPRRANRGPAGQRAALPASAGGCGGARGNPVAGGPRPA